MKISTLIRFWAIFRWFARGCKDDPDPPRDADRWPEVDQVAVESMKSMDTLALQFAYEVRKNLDLSEGGPFMVAKARFSSRIEVASILELGEDYPSCVCVSAAAAVYPSGSAVADGTLPCPIGELNQEGSTRATYWGERTGDTGIPFAVRCTYHAKPIDGLIMFDLFLGDKGDNRTLKTLSQAGKSRPLPQVVPFAFIIEQDDE